MSTTDTLVLLSVLLAVVVVVVLALALIRVRQGLHEISQDLATLGGALETVESEHLRPLEPAVKAINAQFDIILGALPGSPPRPRRRREEAVMTLWWIGDVLLVVVLAVVIYLLHGVLTEARHRPEHPQDRDAARAGSKDLDAVPLLLTTQDQVIKTVETVADYGGSLDVIVDDA